MDILAKNKLLSIALVLFIILNVVSLSLLWVCYNRSGETRKHKPEDNSSKVFELISTELEFTNAQKLVLDSLVNNYMHESEQSRELIRKYHRDINSNIINSISTNELQGKFDTLGIMKAELDKKSFVFFRDLYGICQPKQKGKFKKLHKEINKILTPAPPKPYK